MKHHELMRSLRSKIREIPDPWERAKAWAIYAAMMRDGPWPDRWGINETP